jgi:hypothetical protein
MGAGCEALSSVGDVQQNIGVTRNLRIERAPTGKVMAAQCREVRWCREISAVRPMSLALKPSLICVYAMSDSYFQGSRVTGVPVLLGREAVSPV